MVPKDVAAALLIQELDPIPEFSNTVPKVKVAGVNSTTKLTSLPFRCSVIHQKTWELHRRSPSQASTNITSMTHYICHQFHKVPQVIRKSQ